MSFIQKQNIRQLNNYVRKLIKLLLTATTCPLVDIMVFTCDFSTSISGDPGDVGGTANSSAVLSCSADTLTGPVLHTLYLLVMVMELFGLTIMFMNIIVAPTAMFLSFS